ncbi:hypothetical protein [Nitrospirillum sp. BR 11163]|uniref:hypothetical protein n=1 Tax=Nitrospirillum sp. BR 11163 TaxID=3104323 RepID=UPI002AFF3AD9|nr:hypothetical protein [Nitrospirillum sp. BR 11163]MEA1676101.1 hypothetical protein [Nitrospirillum sp. BR 11163]
MSQSTVILTCTPNSSIEGDGFHVMASVGGGPLHDFQIDTGSSGMAIGAATAGNYTDFPCYGTGAVPI